MRSSVIGFVTQIILIQRNSNGFKTPLPLPPTLLAQSQQLLCKAAPKISIQTCWQRKSRTPFSLAVKWRSLITCENGIDSKEQKIRNDLLKNLMMARFGDSIEFRYRYPGIFSVAVSILTGQVVEKCMCLAKELKQLELESKSPFVLVNDPEHERRIRFHCAM